MNVLLLRFLGTHHVFPKKCSLFVQLKQSYKGFLLSSCPIINSSYLISSSNCRKRCDLNINGKTQHVLLSIVYIKKLNPTIQFIFNMIKQSVQRTKYFTLIARNSFCPNLLNSSTTGNWSVK